MFHNLQEEDYPHRAALCAELIDQIESANLINKIFFCDEVTFHTCGKVNRHNCRIWAVKKPPNILEWGQDTPKVNVWLGVTQSKVYEPFFFAEAMVTGTVYLDMLEQFLEPQLLADGILDTIVFQQDGVPCHYAIIVHDYLDRHFLGHWISRGRTQPWAALSPGLTRLDFFAWGFIKSKVYTGRRIGDLAKLSNRIFDAVQKITPQMLESVFRETIYCFELCRDTLSPCGDK